MNLNFNEGELITTALASSSSTFTDIRGFAFYSFRQLNLESATEQVSDNEAQWLNITMERPF